ncbi:extracellular solute-binding protein [Phenylobacterium sp.]|jgi:putative spermidine/putrescine transport system substrate-binding protein|uniref:extracellular solute-binding protein n=1 Tax=Phenylobacterium sp. TaxID=1871053 RepID=UPI00378480CD
MSRSAWKCAASPPRRSGARWRREPLSALDFKLRRQLQIELKDIQRKLGTTFIFVTHDQDEALTMSDRIAVFSDGEIVQVDTPSNIYNHPRTSFVAQFVGEANIFEAQIDTHANGQVTAWLPELGVNLPLPDPALRPLERTAVAIRPENLRIASTGGAAGVWAPATVTEVVYAGSLVRYGLTAGAKPISVTQTVERGHTDLFSVGDAVHLSWKPGSAMLVQQGPAASHDSSPDRPTIAKKGKLRRRYLLALGGAAAIGGLVVSRLGGSGGGEDAVVMGTWGGGNAEAWRRVLADFQASTGISARVAEWADPEPALRAQASDPKYNVGICTALDTISLQKDGLLESFSDDELPGLSQVDERYVVRARDGRVIGLPIYFSYYGIAFNSALAKPGDFESWSQLGDPKWKGRLAINRTVWAARYDLTLFAHLAGGTEADWRPGLPLLRAQASNSVVAYTGMAQMSSLLSRGEVTAVPYYSARFWGKATVPGVTFQLPREGGLMLPYILVMPKAAKNREQVRALFDYCLQAAVQEKIFAESGYMPMNSEARFTPEQAQRVGMSLGALRQRLYNPDWNVVARTTPARIGAVEKIINGV